MMWPPSGRRFGVTCSSFYFAMPDAAEVGQTGRAFVFTPNTGDGPWPAALLYMDAPAIRPAMFEMGERLAQAGYYVLLPDVFWRAGPYPPLDIVKARNGDPEMGALFAKLRASTSANLQMQDTAVYLEWLAREVSRHHGQRRGPDWDALRAILRRHRRSWRQWLLTLARRH